MLTGYGSQSKSWRLSEFYFARISRVYPIYLAANLLALAAWMPEPVTNLRSLLRLLSFAFVVVVVVVFCLFLLGGGWDLLLSMEKVMKSLWEIIMH